MTRFGDLSPFWQFLEAFGDNFLPKIAPPPIFFYKSFDVDIFGFEKLTYYYGDKFGDFLPKVVIFSLKHLVTLFSMALTIEIVITG